MLCMDGSDGFSLSIIIWLLVDSFDSIVDDDFRGSVAISLS